VGYSPACSNEWHPALCGKPRLNVPGEYIGQLGGGKFAPTGYIDVAILKSLNPRQEVKDEVLKYGQVIVDECHHIPAFTFEQILKHTKARYVVSLMATPTRRDGRHPIVFMECGPVRLSVSAKEHAQIRPFCHVVIPRETEYRLPPELEDGPIQSIYASLAMDPKRNDLIISDLVAVAKAGRSPLLLTERTRQRKAVMERLAAIPDEVSRVVLATGRSIGEGFDDARLDTLFLVMPISWKGTLQLYAGRLHRLHYAKREVQVYDYVDVHAPVLLRMYRRRLTGYRAIGYQVKGPIAER